MQNDFEKQVQKKMEELDLIPSAPVWGKIESQIRQKKEQRRFVLWFILVILLVGGGAIWLSTQSTNSTSSAQTEEINKSNENGNSNTVISNPETSPTIQNQPVTENENSSTNKKQTNFQTEENELTSTSKNKEKNKLQPINTPVSNSKIKNNKNKVSRPVIADTDIPSNSNPTANKKSKPVNTEKNIMVIAPVGEKIFSADNKIPDVIKSDNPANTSPQKNTRAVTKTADTIDTKKTDTLNAVVNSDPVHKNEAITENKLPATDSISNINSAIAVIQSKTKSPKWNFGFQASVGASGLGEAIDLSELVNDKSLMDAAPQASPSSYTRVPYSRSYTPPAVVKKNIAYSISAVVKRLIGKKVEISSGIGYAHYSTLLESGKMDSVNVRFGTSAGNSQSFTAGSTFNNYSNKFHFITVPLNVHFRPFKKTPLNLFGGLAVKQMVATNAMEYNHLTYLYSSDINAYNRTQIFSNFGFEYVVLNKKNQLILGPEITYGISKHLSSGAPQHLYSLGIKAEFIFQKN